MRTRSATAAASCGSWVTRREAVLEAARMSRRSARSSARLGGSSEPNGSSSSRSSGASASARARLTRCASPPDRAVAGRSATSFEPESLDPFRHAPPARRPGDALEAQPGLDIRARGAASQQRPLQDGRTDAADLPRRGRAAVQEHPPAVVTAEAAGDAQQRRLAGPVGAEDREGLPRGDAEPLQRQDRATAGSGDDAFELEQRGHVRCCCTAVRTRFTAKASTSRMMPNAKARANAPFDASSTAAVVRTRV